MYVSHIGKRFIKLYNRKNNTKYSVKEYFENIFFPLFYDNEQYLQSPANTPLFQLIAQKKTDDQNARQEAKSIIAQKIDESVSQKENLPDMSCAIGYPSADYHGTTSGQITSFYFPLSEDDLYASWIGSAFGIGIQGGYNILIDNGKILFSIEEGWKLYRKRVNQNKGINNKIESWNSIWLAHRFSKLYNPEKPSAFNPLSIDKAGNAKIERVAWSNLLFALAREFKSQTMVAYIYSFGQMNKTIGFIQLKLPEVGKLCGFYRHLFGKKLGISNEKLAEIYNTEYGFQTVCERYSILGLRSLEPKDLKKFMPKRGVERKIPTIKDDEKTQITYSIHLTWIVAMLNNKDILMFAEKVANSLKEYVTGETRAKKTRVNQVDKLLGTINRKEFINNLIEIATDDPDRSDLYNEVVNKIMLEISPDNFQIFVTLIRFKYSTIKK